MKKEEKEEIILIRSGDQSMFASVKNDDTVILGDPSTFVYAGVTMVKDQKKIEGIVDDILYSKPVALVKKLKRRNEKK